jgi:glycosyltransferase involved in cell wall biosynthesis
MRVLFCSDALIVDGVTSFVFHLSSALVRGGHRTAVLGRWAGKGFQSRLRANGVEVIQCLSPTVGNAWFDRRAREFAPQVILTDSRRSFPLAQRLKGVTGAKVLTFFLDHLEKTDRPGRDLPSLIRGSDAWLSAEPPILESLSRIPTPFPKILLPRPLEGLLRPSPRPPPDPFRVLCFGRLSGYKSAGPWALLREARALRERIPTLELRFIGGGWRTLKFRALAARHNLAARTRFVRVLGTRIDPQPWFDWATVVCAGSTSAIEAVLAHRPVVGFTGFWLGLLRPDRLEEAFDSYFGERKGEILLRDHPELVGREIARLYETWDPRTLEADVAEVRRRVEPRFRSAEALEAFQRACALVGAEG